MSKMSELDFLVQDQYGGDVDTIHNVRQVGQAPEMTYKNARNAAAYENHGKYDINEYHRDPRYKEINRQISQQKKLELCGMPIRATK